MRQRRLAWLLAIVLGTFPQAAALADKSPPVLVRAGSHEGYGRVVFNFPIRTEYRLTQQGQRVLIQFAGDVTLGSANALPHNVLSVVCQGGQAEIVVAPGTQVRDWRYGALVVIDIADPVAGDGTRPQRPPHPGRRRPATPLPHRLRPTCRHRNRRRSRSRLSGPSRRLQLQHPLCPHKRHRGQRQPWRTTAPATRDQPMTRRFWCQPIASSAPRCSGAATWR